MDFNVGRYYRIGSTRQEEGTYLPLSVILFSFFNCHKQEAINEAYKSK